MTPRVRLTRPLRRRHRFDEFTEYCMKCGIAYMDALKHTPMVCLAVPGKVIAISHIVRGKRLMKMLKR